MIPRCDVGSKGQRPDSFQPGLKARGLVIMRKFFATTTDRRAKGPVRHSIPEVSLIEIDAVFLEECLEFILKCSGSMVFFLIFDVFPQQLQIRGGDGECPIPCLPIEFRKLGRL